jgi:DNA-binding transcriptional MerR regulator
MSKEMMTVHEVSKLTGISIRTLQYYDKIGVLHPARYTEAGYRMYDHNNLEKLQQILLFRELGFPLKDIKNMMEDPGFDREKALDQQIEMLTLKKQQLDELISLARGIKTLGGNCMNFKAFDKSKLEAYAAQAKAAWGQTDAYKEYEKKSEGRSDSDQRALNLQMMEIFYAFGKIKDQDPKSEEARALVKELQDFITEHYYRCTDEILSGLGKAYGSGGEFTQNINEAAGEGAAEFAAKAIEAYCG